MPWSIVILLCVAGTWVSLSILDVQALLAPVLKLYSLLKGLFLKLLPGFIAVLWTTVFLKLFGLLSDAAINLKILSAPLVVSLTSGWKAWSAKKFARHTARFIASISARFVFVNVLFSLLFGNERKSLKELPGYVKNRLMNSWFGRVMLWWNSTSDRHRRLFTGLALCIILIFLGQALIGVSILLFDIVWEIAIWLFGQISRLWRVLSPMLLRLLPNAIGNFFTHRLLPFFADVIPVIRDDHRVLYLRFNLRTGLRGMKYRLYRYSRARRPAIRTSIRPLLSDKLRAGKSKLLDKTRKPDKPG